MATLSFAQKRLWFINELEPGNPAYNDYFSFRLKGQVNVATLQQCIDEIINRHGALRASFKIVDSEPAQVIASSLSFGLQIVDLSERPEIAANVLALELAVEEARRPFNLERGPLLRMTLLQTASDEGLLLFTIHHIISDGWSLGVLIKELTSLYEACSTGAQSALSELPIQYGDFAVWHKKWVEETVLKSQLPYWKTKLADAPPMLDLPFDHPRPALRSYSGRKVALEIASSLGPSLKQYSRHKGATVFMVLIAAFKALLYRYTGQSDLLVGTPIAGRNRSETEALVGLFTNLLVLRTEVSGALSFEECLARCKETAVSAFANQDVPFEILVEELNPERGLSYNPVVQVLFALQNAPAEELKLPRLTLQRFDIDAGTTKFDLALNFIETEDGLKGAFEYNTDLFEIETIERMCRHYLNLLEELLVRPERRVTELQLMSWQERQEMIVEWNQTAAEYPRNRGVGELFEQQVELTPDATAVLNEGEQLTYEELNRRANQLAHYLQKLGVGAEVKVGLCVERSMEMIVGLLGVMKAGGAYLPLDPSYPAERLQYMVEDSALLAVLTQGRLRGLFSGIKEGLPALDLSEAEWQWQEQPETNPDRLGAGLTSESLAYVIYTSGSTGLAKGVMVDHRNLSNYLHWINRSSLAGRHLAIPTLTSLSFDASLKQLLAPLLRGDEIWLLTEDIVKLPRAVLQAVARSSNTVALNCVPSLWRAMLEVLLAGQEDAPAQRLKTLLIGGEQVSQDLLDLTFNLLPKLEVWNLYGPTEATANASCDRLTSNERVTIGRAISNTQLYVLDQRIEPVPTGVNGELYIGGEGVARGYLGKAALTAERFIPNPFGGNAGRRLYRTGDIVRRLNDGRIEYLKRVDDQVKVRGYRIELGEIEAVLNEHPAVAQVSVLAREDELGEKRLVGYVVSRQQVSSQELREYLQGRLPDYMVPGTIVQLEAMPLTTNGKLDRRALPKPEPGGAGPLYVGPRTAVEEIMCGIWAEVLRVEKVGIRDNFFELGGHSLLATQVVSRMRNLLGAEAPLRKLFTHPTVAAIAAEVEGRQRRGGSASEEAIARIPRDRELPLSYAQQRLWFIDQLEPGSAAYNIPCAVRLSGRLDDQALLRTLNEIVRRHEVLRTRFHSKDGEPRQEIQAVGHLQALRLDLRQTDGAEREQMLQEVLRDEARRGFDLSSAPLIRAKLIRLTQDEHVLIANMHHIVSDGWSMEIMLGEFSQLYEAFTEGRESPLPELEIQYADYAVWQRARLQGEVLDAQLQYWKEKLDGLAVLELPTDHARPAVASNRGASERFRLSEEITNGLRQLSRQEGVTLFMSLLASFQALLARYSGQEDIAVGTPIAGRNRQEIEGLIGFFVNTLVMRVDLGGDPTVRELLGRVRETSLGAYAHQDLPFEKLVEDLQPDRSLSHTPLFQVMFAFQSAPLSMLQIGSLTVGVVEVEPTTAKFDLLFLLRDMGNGLSGAVEYDSDLFDPSTVRRLVEHFQVLIQGFIADPNQRLSLLPLMSESEKRLLVREWNQTAAEYDRKICIHQVIEGRARATPDATAVVCKHQRISYRELERSANRAANYLRRRGVGPEVRVGLMMERSIELVIWMVGILKAGGAYVPIDPAYPKPRRDLIVEDSGLEMIVSDQGLAELSGVTELISTLEATEAVEQESPERAESGVLPDNLAYVIYTSGSTGRPKGVALAHRGVIGLMKWAERAYGREELDGVLATTSVCFDLSVYEILVVLGMGGKVILGRSGVEAREEIESGEVVQLNTVPSLIEGVLREGELNPSVKVVNLAGEALSRGLVEQVYGRSGAERVVNLYGPSEDTTYTTMEEEPRGSLERVTIGRGIENTRIFIADEKGELAPIGARGEICIGSESLARCYIGNPEATGERFVPEVWSGVPGERAYKTGDVGRFRDGGKIEYLGRKDHQVKIRGYRIELGEIEEALRGLSGVREAVVNVVESGEGGKSLVGYVVEAGGQERTTGEIRRKLRERLPEPMVPAMYIRLRELPKTPNGKIDRRALPKPDLRVARAQYVGPRTAVEEIVCGIWAEVLRVEKVGIWDNFFELGGHSLLATRVVSRVRSILGVEVPLQVLFTNQTALAFATEIEQQQRGGRDAPVEAIARVSRDRDLPLSFAQQRLWFLDQLAPNNPFYNMPGALRLDGSVNLDALETSINEIIRRHEALRTRFEVKEGEPAQVIGEWEPRKWDRLDLTGLTTEEREAEVNRIAKEEAETGFDLSRGPLLRVKILKLQEEQLVLLYTMHHIVSDGWSMEILIREMGALYRAYSAGEPSPLPELPIQYGDFALWQRAWLQGETLAAELEYWRKRLQGVEILELPADHPRPSMPSYRGASRHFAIERESVEKLKELAQREGATLFMMLLGGFAILVSRYSGQKDVALGTDIANRNRAEIEGLIGFFVNQLVMRVEVRGEENFREFLKRVREVCLGAYGRQNVPFEKLVEELEPERDLSRSPLFQVKLLLQNTPQEGLELGETNLSVIGGGEVRARFDLTMIITDKGYDLVGTANYSQDLFEEETIERLMSHYANVLRGIVGGGLIEAVERPVSQLSLLDDQERKQILAEWNQTSKPYPNNRCLHELIAEQAAWTPERIALVGDGWQVSYGELNRRASQLGNYLQGLGVGPEVVVGLCLSRSMEMVVAVLGVLKSGGTYLPLDPESPLERLGYMLEDAGAGVALTETELGERLPSFWGQTICLDEEWERIREQSDREPESGAEAENLAYVIYTSGSTGRPKGVMVAHKGVCNLVEVQKNAFGLGDRSRVLQFASLSFDASAWEIFSALIAGGSLHIRRQERLIPGDDLVRVLREDRITTATFPPTVLAVLREEGLIDLETLIAAGEACSAEIVERWAKERRFFDAYGPTEATVCASMGKCEAGSDRRPTIGRPIANTQLFILDREVNPAPMGVRGELHIAGVGLARGYLKRPELTAERFIPNPFNGECGGRLYRTGDIARYLSDGEIEFIGRADEQVKLRGYRIELGEIQAVLDEHRSVRQSVVVALEGERGSQRLLGYVVGGEGATSAELKKYLRERLPEYMVPETILLLEEMPVTVNGKIDRKRLPLPEDVGRQSGREYADARTPMEEILVGIFEEVLKLNRVGVYDNFFELGGHSLLATQVVSRIRRVFSVELELRGLFESPTARELAYRVASMMRQGEVVTTPAIRSADRSRSLPLSYAQQRLWFIDQLEPGSAAYNIPFALRLEGELNVRAVAASVSEIVRRHEALRTTFPVRNGKPEQRIAPAEAAPLPVVDLSGLAEAESVARQLAAEEARRRFDLATGPLLRVSLLRLNASDHALLATMHHVVSDGWSLGILAREFTAIYESCHKAEPSPLPELPIQYADYSVWQRQWLQGEALDRQLAYWRERLEGLRPLELPADHRRPPTPSHKAGAVGLRLGAEQSEELRALSRREGATLFMTLLAGFQVALGRITGERDVVVGTDVANRNRLETEGLIGFFVNQLVLRTSIDGNPPFVELLGRVRDAALGAYAHQDVPFEKLVEEIAPERSLNRAPLFQVKFLLQNDSGVRLRLPRLELSALDDPTELTKLDLILILRESPEGISGILQYADEIFEPSTIERLGVRLRTVLEGIAEDADRRIGELPLLPHTEREQVLREWNETERAYQQESVVDWIEQQVSEAPDAVALALEERYVSYQELNERANRLARYLRELGIEPEVRVALCFERGFEMVISLLSVLKAGGVYVPLEPGHPIERLAWMLEDAQARVVLSEERLRNRVPSSWAMAVWVDSDWAEIEQRSEANPERRVGSEDLAYMIYTSGSTGRPKGVMVTHGGLANYVRWALEAYEVEGGNGAALHGSLSFDLTVTSLLPPLSAGRRVVVVRAGDGIEAVGLRRLGLLKMTPGQMEALASRVEAKEAGDVSKWMVVGGEALRWETVRFWRREAPGTRIINEYGPTETVVGCCIYEVREQEERWSAAPIGRPIANLRAYVTDEWGEPAGVGVAGELSIGGAGVARGYHARPDLTAEKFVPDAYGPCAGARVYRTGDRARWLEEGNLEFLGRIDDQVKIHGYRIEPGEIEAALSRHGGVRQCVVVAREDGRGDKRLVAYVAVGGSPGPEVNELRSALQRELPEYMTPSAFVLMERLPLTVNGKVDRKALPEPEVKRAGESVAPRTATEEIIAGIWAEVLERDHVGMEENFFDLGGHSLLATQVVSRLGKVFGVELSVRALFESPTVIALARQVEGVGEWREAPPIERVGRECELPLSFAQQRLWFIDQLDPGSVAYNLPHAFRLIGILDIGAVTGSLSEIMRRHESLRTSFPARDGKPAQRIALAEAAPLPVVDLSGLAETESVARQLAAEEARRRFDLATGPLLRVSLLRLDAGDHMLLATMHHAVSDGWSVGILVREFTALYEACRKGESSPLPELPIQYADYSVWQRQWLQGEALDRQLAYWRARLEGLRPLELPADRRRPLTPVHRAEIAELQLGAELSESLRALSRREGVTLFMSMLAAFQVALARYSGQLDIAVGAPIAGRNQREIEGLIGFFVNTLVMRVDMSDNPTVKELLGRVRETALGAYAHQDLPFETLVERLQPERSLSRTPLFQVMIVMQNVHITRGELADLSIETLPVEGDITKFDLVLSMSEGPAGLAGLLQYSADLFERDRINQMLSHLKRMLEGMIENEQSRVMELPLMNEKERQEVIVEWNQTQAEFSQDICIHTLFERQSERAPDVVAAVFESQLISYRELNRRANQLAHHLKSRGIGRGKLVAIYMERSLDMLIALLGILKAGGGYVPLETSFPEGRLDYILNSLQVGCLITQARYWEKLEKMRSRLTALRDAVCLGAAAPIQNDGQVRVWQMSDLERQAADNLDPQAGPDDLAYIIFTSGSTGHPKGVTLQHRPVVNLIEWVNRVFSVNVDDRVLFITSLCFDLSVYDIFGLLAAGGTIHVVGEEQIREPQCLLDSLCQEQITFWDSAPAALQQLTPFFTESKHEAETSQLRLVFLSGDWIPVKLPDQVKEVFTKAKVVGLGGATEAAIWSNYYPVDKSSSEFVSIPYGKPIQNASYYILDNRMEPCPIGVRGDLYIGGKCLALGYINEPALTAEKFAPNPYEAQEGARLYKTGDLARWRADGNIEFLGRVDHQVKIRGYRIELGEIEAALNQHASLEQAVVLAREDEPGEKRLVGYVVGHRQVSGRELREYLQERLPDYMVPGAFVQLDELPLTANGKLDRRALPKPKLGGADTEYVGPRTTVEEIMCGIWAEALKVEKVGVYDNFFELGGHSLLATQVVSRVRSALGVEVSLRSLFVAPTVAVMATEVGQRKRSGGEAPVEAIARVARDRELPLSYAQQRMWFVDQLEPGSAAYNLPCAVRLRGELNADALSRSLNEIIARHEVLRTHFPSRNGEPRQEIREFCDLQPEFIDLMQTDKAEPGQKLQEILLDESKRGFDLSSGPLIRAKLIRLAQDEHALIVNMHHIVSDGWSLEIIVREFAQLYGAFSQGQESQLPELEIQYADYAMWQRMWLQGDALYRQLQYWRRQLEGLETLELPTDRARPAVASYRGSSEKIVLSEELTQKLKQLSKREGVTLFMSLLAGFQLLLARYSGQHDITVGTPIAGRNRKETEGLIGLFLNTLVMRVNVGGNPSVRELLARVREAALGAYAHQDLPFEKLVEEIRPERSLSHQPLFQVWFVLQNIPAERIDLPGLRVEELPIEDHFTKFDLMLSLSEGQKELTGTLRYSTDLFDRRRIKRLLSHYEQILEGMAADEDSHSTEYDIERERRQHKAID